MFWNGGKPRKSSLAQSLWESGHYLEKILFTVFQHILTELFLYAEEAGGEKSDIVPVFMVLTTEQGKQQSSKTGLEARWLVPAAVGSRIFTQYPLCAGGQSQHSTVAHQPGPQPLKEAGPTSFYRSVAHEWVLVSQWDEIISESLSPGFSNSERTMMPPWGQGPGLGAAPKDYSCRVGWGLPQDRQPSVMLLLIHISLAYLTSRLLAVHNS